VLRVDIAADGQPVRVDAFADRFDHAWQWCDAAIEEAQEGRWIRDAVERQVLEDVQVATNALHSGRHAPFVEDVWGLG
jgi:hypothetical protein